jgi:HTH-type transcriptional regulator, cell division transcriptional repressor
MQSNRTTQEGGTLLQKNLRWWMQQNDVNQIRLAELASLTQPTVNRVLKGKSLPREHTIVALARVMGVTAETLVRTDFAEQTETPAHLRSTRVPFMSAQDVARLARKQIRRDHWPDTVLVNKKVSHGSLMMTNHDEGMEPLYMKGDWMLYDPDVRPSPNKIVVAVVEGLDHAIVRRYKVMSFSEAKRDFELIPENPTFPPISSRKTDIKILGTVMQYTRDVP